VIESGDLRVEFPGMELRLAEGHRSVRSVKGDLLFGLAFDVPLNARKAMCMGGGLGFEALDDRRKSIELFPAAEKVLFKLMARVLRKQAVSADFIHLPHGHC
jgi:hypothetical protein